MMKTTEYICDICGEPICQITEPRFNRDVAVEIYYEGGQIKISETHDKCREKLFYCLVSFIKEYRTAARIIST